MLFREIIGLEDTKATLINAIRSNHVAHAQLFLGNEGTANLTLALAYATYINCENKQPTDACGVCSSCIKMAKFIHPDLHFVLPIAGNSKITKPKTADFMKEWRTFLQQNPYQNLSHWLTMIDAESKQPSISAEEARGILGTLSMKSFEGEYKVLIIWLPEYMNITAANAILKILEEPPEKTLFLLVAQNLDKMLVTILSRTQLVRVRDFEEAEIQTYLSTELDAPLSKAQQVAKLAEGSLLKAKELIEGISDDNQVVFRDWMRDCYGRKIPDLYAKMEIFAKKSKDEQKNLLLYGLNICRESLVWQYAGEEIVRLDGENLTFVQGFAKVINPNNVGYLSDYLSDALAHLERNASAKIVFLDTSLKISNVIKIQA